MHGQGYVGVILLPVLIALYSLNTAQRSRDLFMIDDSCGLRI